MQAFAGYGRSKNTTMSLFSILTLYGFKIRNRTTNLQRPVGRTNIYIKGKSCQRGRRYSKLVVGNSPGRRSALFSTI